MLKVTVGKAQTKPVPTPSMTLDEAAKRITDIESRLQQVEAEVKVRKQGG